MDIKNIINELQEEIENNREEIIKLENKCLKISEVIENLKNLDIEKEELMEKIAKTKPPKFKHHISDIDKEKKKKGYTHSNQKYPDKLKAFVERHMNQNTNIQLSNLINEKFDCDITPMKLSSFMNYNQLRRAYKQLSTDKKKPETLKGSKPITKTKIYSNAKNKRTLFTDELSKFLKDNLKFSNSYISDLVRRKFGINLKEKQLADFYYTRGLGAMRKRARKINKEEQNLNSKKPERSGSGRIITKKKKLFSDEIDNFIKSMWKGKTDSDLRELIGEKFGVWYTKDQIKDHRKTLGLVGDHGGRKTKRSFEDEEKSEEKPKSIEQLQNQYESEDDNLLDAMED